MNLYPHQQEAAERVAREWMPGGAGLFFEQRCGKTRTAIEIARLRGCKRVLVLCPSQKGNVPKVWQEEARAVWPTMRTIILEGANVQRVRQVQDLDGPAIVICNYEMACRPPLGPIVGKRGAVQRPGALVAAKWDMLIVDESHRVKAPTGQWQRTCALIARNTPMRLALTGTPMHTPLDIWGQYNIIDPTVFGSSYVSFRVKHTRKAQKHELGDKDLIWIRGKDGNEAYKLNNLDEIHRRMYSRAIRVTLKDVFPDLPPDRDERRTVALEPDARRLYRELERELALSLGDGLVTAANGGVLVLRLQQFTGGTLVPMAIEVDDDGVAKVARQEPVIVSRVKEELLTEILQDSDEPVVVFGRFHSDLDAIHRACAAVGLPLQPELSGRVKAGQLEYWQRGRDALTGEPNPEVNRVLVAQIQAGGVGIDLTRTCHVIYYSPGRSLIDYEQSRSRPLGPRQTRPVTRTHLVVEGTADEDVYDGLTNHRDIVASVVDRLRNVASAAATAVRS